MKFNTFKYLLLLLLLGATPFLSAQQSGMQFIENQGQWKDDIAFSTKLTFGDIYFEDNNFTFILKDYSSLDHDHDHEHSDAEIETIAAHHFKMQFEGANASIRFKSENPAADYNNYFIGNDHSKWASNVPKFSAITYEDLYDGIDMKVYGSSDNMKYEYYVAPGVDPSLIAVKYVGIETLNLEGGDLVYSTAVSNIKELKPYVYQVVKGKRKRVNAEYQIDPTTNTVSYKILGNYNSNQELVIDPTLIFSSYSGSFRDNFGFTATYDDNGLTYGGGMARDAVLVGGDYPTTLGAFDVTYNGAVDIGISVFSADGTSLVYSTFVGGSAGDIPNSMIVNNAGELVVLATVSSSDFPMPFLGTSFDNTFNGGSPVAVGSYGVNFDFGTDIAVFKLSPNGSQLLGSTYVGGSANDGVNEDNNFAFPYDGSDLHYNYGDFFRGEVIVDDQDNVYVASSTNSSNFPATFGAADITLGGLQDACSFKLNTSLNTMLWCTYYGGSNLDAGYSQKIDNAGNLVFTGGTKSTDLLVSPGCLNPNYLGGVADGYIAKLNGLNGSFLNGTYLGTNSYDQGFLIDVDDDNEIYVVGQTEGAYPVQTMGTVNPGSAQFIHKLNSNLSSTVFSTVFGSGINQVNISPTAFQVDICERIYVSGWGGVVNQGRNVNTGFTQNLPITLDALKNEAQTDGSDFYFIVFEKNLNGVLFATYFGGGSPVFPVREHVDGGTSRFDKNAFIYQAVCAGCGGSSAFPTQPGVVSQINNSSNCNLGVIKVDIELPTTNVDLIANPTATGCVPLVVNLTSILSNVSSFEWDFGDGSPISTQPNPIHTYNDTGVYEIRLIGIDSNSCNIADTAFLSVVVGDDTLIANFQDSIDVDCDNNVINISGPDNYPNTQYFWNMGDGNTYNTQFVTHSYTAAGNYTIELLIVDSTSCELRDSSTTSVVIAPPFQAELSASDTFGCIPYSINFNNLYADADVTIWDFGDGSPASTLQNPTHTFLTVDTFTVQLAVLDSSTCNLWDTVTQMIIGYNDSIIATMVTDPTFFECDSMQLNVYSTTPSATDHFWDFDNGSTSADSASQTLYQVGAFDGIYIATDTNLLCEQSDTVPFFVNLIEEIEVSIDVPDTLGCIPFEVNFDGITNIPVNEYIWDFGTGDSAFIEDPVYIYPNIGQYTVTLIAINPLTCNGADTAQITIEVINDSVNANYTITETLFECDSLSVQLNGTYIGGIHEWDMGNGDIVTGMSSSYTYTIFGDYTITHTVTDSSQICYPIDSSTYPIHFEPVIASFTAMDTSGCIPLDVTLNNTSNGISYLWDFDISTSGVDQPGVVTFNTVDTFNIQLIAFDSTSCNLQDTALQEIITRDDFVLADYSFTIIEQCDSLLSIQLDNQSMDATSYLWDFQTSTSTLEEPGTVDYTLPGNYTITLIANNPNLCHPSDTVSNNFSLLPNSNAAFEVDPNCESLLLNINNTSIAQTYDWDFGDGGSSNLEFPVYSYNAAGDYTVTLIVYDTLSCNFTDTAMATVEILPFPIAQFFTDSNYYIYPDEVTFTNQSQNFDSFIWEFGDGTTNNFDENPIHAFEEVYEITTCLEVWNDYCADTFCKDFFIDFIELIGVPNSFSPNGDGVNDIIYVEGVGIEYLLFRIYNRWGELIFESRDQSLGWDGTFRGVKQEMEVYTYLVDATYINGVNTKLKGNITLLK